MPDQRQVWINDSKHNLEAAHEHGGSGPDAFRAMIHPFAAHIRKKTRHFVGRRWVFHEIDRHFEDREQFPSGYILITAVRGDAGASSDAAREEIEH